MHLAYLVLRENLINRLFDQNSGYWQNGLHGLDALTDADHGAALVDYLGALRRADRGGGRAHDRRRQARTGRGRRCGWAQARLPDSAALTAARELAYLKLMEKYQEFNPFKFIVYAGQIDQSARADRCAGRWIPAAMRPPLSSAG